MEYLPLKRRTLGWREALLKIGLEFGMFFEPTSVRDLEMDKLLYLHSRNLEPFRDGIR